LATGAQSICGIFCPSSDILRLHFELGRRPRPPPPGKVDCESKCGSWVSNQTGRVGPPKPAGFEFSKTDADTATLQVYQNTEYYVLGETHFILRIGTINDETQLNAHTSNGVDYSPLFPRVR
jgi:hypothetical protein